MNSIRHLRSAPILESLVDFRATLPKDVNLEALNGLSGQLRDRYPIVEGMNRFETSITWQPGADKPVNAQTATAVRPAGYSFISADRLNVAQLHVNGFTYHRLRPYTSWDEIRPEVLSLWALYRQTVRPETCPRITVRYINKIDVPTGEAELSDFLTAPPRLPKGLPNVLTSFLTRVIVHGSQPDVFATVTQASQVQLDPRLSAIMLDIEVYKQSDGGALADRAEATLAELHQLKNRIFFGSVTKRQLKRYE